MLTDHFSDLRHYLYDMKYNKVNNKAVCQNEVR